MVGHPDPVLEPLGDPTAAMLLATFQDAYRQEIAAEEDVHRTLPFFATALGFIVAALNYAAGQLHDWQSLTKSCVRGGGLPLDYHHTLACTWPVMVAIALLVVSAVLGIGALAYLAAATRRHGYKRVGTEPALLARARELQGYHLTRNLPELASDLAVHRDLRQQLLEALAEAVSFNRILTLSRYTLRARAVAFLLASLFAALVATILVMMTAKTGLLTR